MLKCDISIKLKCYALQFSIPTVLPREAGIVSHIGSQSLLWRDVLYAWTSEDDEFFSSIRNVSWCPRFR